MAKKIIAILFIAAGLTVLQAQEQAATTPAPVPAPKTGIEISELLGAETYDGIIKAAGYGGNDAVLSRTEAKGKVDFDLGSGIKLSPWVKERFEIKANPGTTTALDSWIRNRFYAGFDASFALDKVFNVALSGEYRNTASLKASSTSLPVLDEVRFVPYLTISGAADIFYYSVGADIPLYLDLTVGSLDNGKNDFKYDFENNANLGFGFKLDDKTVLKLDLANYLGLYFPTTFASAADPDPTLNDDFRARLVLVAGDIKPYLGFVYNISANNAQVTVENVVGTTFGVDVVAGIATFSFASDIGVDTAAVSGTNPLVTRLTTTVKLKY